MSDERNEFTANATPAETHPEAVQPPTSDAPKEEIAPPAAAGAEASKASNDPIRDRTAAAPQSGDTPPAKAARTGEEPRALTIIAEPSARFGGAPPASGHTFIRRHGLTVTLLSLAMAVGLAGAYAIGRKDLGFFSISRIATAPPTKPAEVNTSVQMAQLEAEIRSLSSNLESMRGQLEPLRASTESMRANSETLRTNFEALRASTDRSRQAEDIRALKKSIDAIKEGFDQAKADSSAALAQAAQKLDKADRESGAKVAAMADRLDRLERDQAAKLGQLGERVDRIDRRTNVSAEVTGSIPKPAPLPTATPTPPADPPAPPKPPTVPGLVVRDVEGGTALIEGRGGLFEISQGDVIPGVGRVESIERRGKEWVVVTPRGVIESPRR